MLNVPWPPRRHSNAATVTSERAARAQHARDLARRRLFDLVGQAVEHVERRHHIEAGVGNGIAPMLARTTRDAVRSRELQAPRGQIEAERAAMARQQLQVGAGAAAAVEQPQVSPAAAAGCQPRRDEPAEASKPEVGAFGAVGELEQAVHAARATPWVRLVAAPWYHTSHMRHRGLAEAAAVLAGAFVLTAALTFPLVPKLDRVGRVNTDDGRLSIWNVAWVADALIVNPRRLFDANIFYPADNTLAYSEANIGAGLMALPAWGLTGNPYLAHNTAVVIAFLMAVAGAYYLVRYLSGSREAAVAAVLFGFCPYIFARTAHIQLLMTGGLPFSMLAFHRLVDRPGRARAVVLGAVLWFQALSTTVTRR